MDRRISFVFTISIILLVTTGNTKSLLADVKQNSNVIGYGFINSSFTYLRELPTHENPKGAAIGMLPIAAAVKIIKTKKIYISGKYQYKLYFIKGFHKNRAYSGWVQEADVNISSSEKFYNDAEMQYQFQINLGKIRIGMLKNEVLNIMGNPSSISKFNKQNYVYYYNKSNASIPISFENDRVASIGTDLNNFWEKNKENEKVISSKTEPLLQKAKVIK